MLTIKKSNIHGIGVFTSEIIKKNTILEFKTKIVNENEFESYQYPWFGKSVICGLASFFNHSTEFNLKILNRNKEKNILKFIVIKQIKKNEELTFNYDT